MLQFTLILLLVLLAYMVYRLAGRKKELEILVRQRENLLLSSDALLYMQKHAIEHSDWRRDESSIFLIAHFNRAVEMHNHEMLRHIIACRVFNNPIFWLLSKKLK